MWCNYWLSAYFNALYLGENENSSHSSDVKGAVVSELTLLDVKAYVCGS